MNVYTKLLLTKISFHLKVVSSGVVGLGGPWALPSVMSWDIVEGRVCPGLTPGDCPKALRLF